MKTNALIKKHLRTQQFILLKLVFKVDGKLSILAIFNECSNNSHFTNLSLLLFTLFYQVSRRNN